MNEAKSLLRVLLVDIHETTFIKSRLNQPKTKKPITSK